MMNDEYFNHILKNLEMTVENKKQSDPLSDKTLKFAIRIVNLNRYLTEQKKEYVLSKQVLRSGTNPGAMVREAANAESGADFIHKLAIGQKEISETLYWLELLSETDYLTKTEYQSLVNDGTQILKIIRSSILTKKQRLAAKITSIILLIATIAFTIF
jgi:four helix bundle protein